MNSREALNDDLRAWYNSLPCDDIGKEHWDKLQVAIGKHWPRAGAQSVAMPRMTMMNANAVALLRTIAEGYPVSAWDDRYIQVPNPDFQEDNGSDPFLLLDVAALRAPEVDKGVVVARVPKVRTGHHRNKEEADRLQSLVNKRYTTPVSAAGIAAPPTRDAVLAAWKRIEMAGLNFLMPRQIKLILDEMSSALAAPPAASAEAVRREQVIEECVKIIDAEAAFYECERIRLIKFHTSVDSPYRDELCSVSAKRNALENSAALIRALSAPVAGADAGMRAELDAISAAIGTVRFMDPPDGGDVSLAEQVRRMRAALNAAEGDAGMRERAALIEECAKISEGHFSGVEAAEAIRALSIFPSHDPQGVISERQEVMTPDRDSEMQGRLPRDLHQGEPSHD